MFQSFSSLYKIDITKECARSLDAIPNSLMNSSMKLPKPPILFLCLFDSFLKDAYVVLHPILFSTHGDLLWTVEFTFARNFSGKVGSMDCLLYLGVVSTCFWVPSPTSKIRSLITSHIFQRYSVSLHTFLFTIRRDWYLWIGFTQWHQYYV